MGETILLLVILHPIKSRALYFRLKLNNWRRGNAYSTQTINIFNQEQVIFLFGDSNLYMSFLLHVILMINWHIILEESAFSRK